MECAVGPVQRPAIPVPAPDSLHLRCISVYLSPVPASDTLQARVERALSQLKNPRSGNDILSAGMVKDLVVAGGGAGAVTSPLRRRGPAPLTLPGGTAGRGAPWAGGAAGDAS